MTGEKKWSFTAGLGLLVIAILMTPLLMIAKLRRRRAKL